LHHNEISGIIVDTAVQVHKKLGPGLLESVYQDVMTYEPRKCGLCIEEQRAIPVVWDEMRMEVGFRADLIVEDKVIVELKSVERITPVFQKILLTYLRLADKRLGLLINFGEALMKDGIYRVVNDLKE